ncbi:MAG: hypothetical protein A3C55_05290 [Gammaproteobacteria bacterium RIFCSPHIGHO2_02_FULL_42_13]|nr:MAG: hypothetical protein A3C55_05290 [Gammaproteobacteria bacterium RIFCSPHIGHO2_02_FULL_42_13]OGT68222.1 MAG: hypothetical protein A3H43_05140 [Gammaproteobacteria bacterium RIFCSPLOWO2_02_FULL_42_9]
MLRKKYSAFTLIELIIVVVILGILAAIAIPTYVDLSTDAINASKKAMVGIVKSAFAIAIAENKTHPSVKELAGYVQKSTAVAYGIQLPIDEEFYTIPTYSDPICSTLTVSDEDIVLCVGDLAMSDAEGGGPTSSFSARSS